MARSVVLRLDEDLARQVKRLESILGRSELAKVLKSLEKKSEKRFWFKKWWE